MKNKSAVPAIQGRGYLFILLVFILPFLYLYMVTGQGNPFAIRGPLFLRFYGICCGCSYVAVLVPLLLQPPVEFYRVLQRATIIVLLLGVARLCQGIYHGKPVGYLLLLLVVQFILWPVGRVLYKKKR